MREAQFLKQNADKWKQYEEELRTRQNADLLADRFVELTDDVAYSRTFYPKSSTSKYLNGLAASFHQQIYRNKKEDRGRIWNFWQFELPYLFLQYRKQFMYAFIFFLLFCAIGALSAKYDENFIRLILGDAYVNMTNENIEKGDPFGVYKSSDRLPMFLAIASNNIRVSFIAYILGSTFGIGTIWMLLSNGLMLGSFQYYFISKGLGLKSVSVIFVHGTLEIWSIVIAGAAGLILGNSLLFPGTYARSISFVKGGKDGLKVVMGLVPLFIVAAFLEGFVTRYDNMPWWLSWTILAVSLAFLIWYFIIYPLQLKNRIEQADNRSSIAAENLNFNQWLSKKLNSEGSGILAKH